MADAPGRSAISTIGDVLLSPGTITSVPHYGVSSEDIILLTALNQGGADALASGYFTDAYKGSFAIHHVAGVGPRSVRYAFFARANTR